MALTYQSIVANVVAVLNANPGTWSEDSTNPAYLDQQIQDSVLTAEGEVIESILLSPFQGRRQHAAALIAEVELDNGQAVPSHIGPLISVFVEDRRSVAAPLELVTRVNQGLSMRIDKRLKTGLYAEDLSGNLYFTGTGKAKVKYGKYQRPEFVDRAAFLAATPLAPPETFGEIVDKAVGYMLPKDGDNVQTGVAHYTRADNRRRERLGMKTLVPELKVAEKRPDTEV